MILLPPTEVWTEPEGKQEEKIMDNMSFGSVSPGSVMIGGGYIRSLPAGFYGVFSYDSKDTP